MKAILLKDYLEQRMYFVIILAVAALSLLAAAFFGQLDSGVALVILFILQGPLFIYLAANHQISSEVNNGTWRFLTALPSAACACGRRNSSSPPFTPRHSTRSIW